MLRPCTAGAPQLERPEAQRPPQATAITMQRCQARRFEVPAVLQPATTSALHGLALHARQDPLQTGVHIWVCLTMGSPKMGGRSKTPKRPQPKKKVTQCGLTWREVPFPENIEDAKWVCIPLVQTERAWAFGVRQAA